MPINNGDQNRSETIPPEKVPRRTSKNLNKVRENLIGLEFVALSWVMNDWSSETVRSVRKNTVWDDKLRAIRSAVRKGIPRSPEHWGPELIYADYMAMHDVVTAFRNNCVNKLAQSPYGGLYEEILQIPVAVGQRVVSIPRTYPHKRPLDPGKADGAKGQDAINWQTESIDAIVLRMVESRFNTTYETIDRARYIGDGNTFINKKGRKIKSRFQTDAAQRHLIGLFIYLATSSHSDADAWPAGIIDLLWKMRTDVLGIYYLVRWSHTVHEGTEVRVPPLCQLRELAEGLLPH